MRQVHFRDWMVSTAIRTLRHMSIDTTTTRTPTQWVELADEIGTTLRPDVAESDRTGEISRAAFDRLRHDGITAALVPPEFGGGGASHADMGEILRTLAHHDPSTAVTLSMHSHLVAAQVWRQRHGIDAEKVLRKVGEDRAVLISTGASDWVSSNGTATKVDGGFRVTARKSPASGCEIGQVFVTSIRWSDAPDGPQVLHCSVPASAEGVSIDVTWDTLGLRATGSHTVVFDDVFVPEASISLIRPADVWHPVWNTVMGCAMPLIMAAYLGIADAAAALAVSAAEGRDAPHVFQQLGEMTNRHLTAQDAVTAMFADSENLQFANTDALSSRILSRKSVAAAAIIDTVQLAAEVVGGAAFSRGNDMERLLRDAHGVVYHPLPLAKQTQFTGRVALGLPPVG
jgi:acyl-CoA dehydrogenase